MCLIVFSWNPEASRPLVLAANRDEFHHRPSQDAHYWPDMPRIFAGRDLKMQGTWLGLSKNTNNKGFRLAALTNFRRPDSQSYQRSRGEITRNFLASDQAALTYCEHIPVADYAGFNGLFFDGTELIYLHHEKNHKPDISRLTQGNYGLSNARLDTPWPKVTRTRKALDQLPLQLEHSDMAHQLFQILSDRQLAERDQLPVTGVGLELETMLSAPFIVSPQYGTRTSTVIVIDNSEKPPKMRQTAYFNERQFTLAGQLDRSLSQFFD